MESNKKSNKNLDIHFRLSQAERDYIDKNFKRFSTKKKTSISKFIIEACIKYYATSEDKTRKVELLDILITADMIKDEINRIGVNLNQVAKKINSFDKYSRIIENEAGYFKTEFKGLVEFSNSINQLTDFVMILYKAK
jgi:Bacterial mobilisation protein (MobC)